MADLQLGGLASDKLFLVLFCLLLVFNLLFVVRDAVLVFVRMLDWLKATWA